MTIQPLFPSDSSLRFFKGKDERAQLGHVFVPPTKKKPAFPVLTEGTQAGTLLPTLHRWIRGNVGHFFAIPTYSPLQYIISTTETEIPRCTFNLCLHLNSKMHPDR